MKFSEMIITKFNPLDTTERFSPSEAELPVAPRVRATAAVTFSPDCSQFVMNVNSDEINPLPVTGQLWLFKAINFNANEPNYSLEKYQQAIAVSDQRRFYKDVPIIPNASFLKELTPQSKSNFVARPLWSPDGTKLAYSHVDLERETVWPHILMGNNFEKDLAISIPNYLPFTKDRWARKAVEVLFGGENGDLYLIEATRYKIYRIPAANQEFAASVLVEFIASGKPTILYPVVRREWLAYTMSLDDAMTIHLKNIQTDEERTLRLAVSGSGIGVVRDLAW